MVENPNSVHRHDRDLYEESREDISPSASLDAAPVMPDQLGERRKGWDVNSVVLLFHCICILFNLAVNCSLICSDADNVDDTLWDMKNAGDEDRVWKLSYKGKRVDKTFPTQLHYLSPYLTLSLPQGSDEAQSHILSPSISILETEGHSAGHAMPMSSGPTGKLVAGIGMNAANEFAATWATSDSRSSSPKVSVAMALPFTLSKIRSSVPI